MRPPCLRQHALWLPTPAGLRVRQLQASPKSQSKPCFHGWGYGRAGVSCAVHCYRADSWVPAFHCATSCSATLLAWMGGHSTQPDKGFSCRAGGFPAGGTRAAGAALQEQGSAGPSGRLAVPVPPTGVHESRETLSAAAQAALDSSGAASELFPRHFSQPRFQLLAPKASSHHAQQTRCEPGAARSAARFWARRGAPRRAWTALQGSLQPCPMRRQRCRGRARRPPGL